MCNHTYITSAIQSLPASESYRRIRESLVKTSALAKKRPYCYEFEDGGPDKGSTCTLSKSLASVVKPELKWKDTTAARSESVSSFTTPWL